MPALLERESALLIPLFTDPAAQFPSFPRLLSARESTNIH